MNIKRILASLLAVTVVGASMPTVSVNFPKLSITANAEESESPLKYKVLENDTIEITDCDESATSVVIPAKIEGLPVTSIGYSAFYYCESLTSITIPDSVTSIGERAFFYCPSLEFITIPDSVTSIREYAFDSCKKLTSITIPDSVTRICDNTFSSCSGLTEITIPNSVTSIGRYAFSECSKLTTVTIPDSVTSIGYGAFKNCSALTSLTIPDSVTSIGGLAFEGTQWLENKQKENPLVIVNGILVDGKNCSGNVIIPDSVTSIGDVSFYECSDLTAITIPNSVTSIGDYVFVGCSELMSITILNPNCKINNNPGSISNGRDDNNIFYFNGTIYGYENSTAQAYAEKYNRKFELIGDAPETKVIAGDANCDGKVSIADATAILQHLGNQDKYGLSAEGLKNADVDGNDGVSTNDALVIQMVDADLLTVEQLPLIEQQK